MSDDALLDQVTAQVLEGAKYRAIHPGLVRRLAAAELAAGRSAKDMIKATRRRLHQIGAVYLQGTPRYDRWLHLLNEACGSGDPLQVKEACRTILGAHQSSRERLALLDTFYSDLLGGLGPVDSVLDLACGLNPLAIPWMPLAADAQYHARDIFEDLMHFVQQALPLLGASGSASTSDVLVDEPAPAVQVCLLLKSVPCLEQVDRTAGERLLQRIPAPYVVVSFPTASLGGRRDRGMLHTYRERMARICEGHPWSLREHLWDTELAYLVTKSGDQIGGGGYG